MRSNNKNQALLFATAYDLAAKPILNKVGKSMKKYKHPADASYKRQIKWAREIEKIIPKTISLLNKVAGAQRRRIL